MGILRPSTRRWNVDGNNERLLTPGEVAALFRVDPKTVTRWAASGRITSIRTPGGHRRFRESEVRALLRGDNEVSPEGHPALLSRGRPPGDQSRRVTQALGCYPLRSCSSLLRG